MKIQWDRMEVNVFELTESKEDAQAVGEALRREGWEEKPGGVFACRDTELPVKFGGSTNGT